MSQEARKFSEILTNLYEQFQREPELPLGYYSVGYICIDPKTQTTYWESRINVNNQPTFNIEEPTTTLPIPDDITRIHDLECTNPNHSLYFRANQLPGKQHFVGQVEGEI